MSHLFLPYSLTTTLFTLSTALPFPECQVVRIILFGGFSDRLLSLNNVQLRSLCVFSQLEARFFSALNNGLNIHIFYVGLE